MCGRYALSISVGDLPNPLRERMDAEHQRRYAPRELICPGEPVLALRRDQTGPESALMLWGLIPSWSKDPTQGPRPINARSETVAEKASFRGAWRHRRCLIPASAFLERGRRFQRVDGQPFWLAGLWERWLGSDGSELDTCTILTTTPNAPVKPLHPRMPVTIPQVWKRLGWHLPMGISCGRSSHCSIRGTHRGGSWWNRRLLRDSCRCWDRWGCERQPQLASNKVCQ